MKKRSRPLKALFACLLCLGLFAAMEVASVALHRALKKGRSPSATYGPEIIKFASDKDVHGYGQSRVNRSEAPMGGVVEVIHPYLGFVQDPLRNPSVTEQGFPAAGKPVRDSGHEQVVVGIFGGSFAEGIFFSAKQAWEEMAFGGKPVQVRNFAIPGFKQPQQLMTLAYMLSLGEQIDIVINIDGFNEVSLPPVENVARHVFPLYPRSWSLRVANMGSQETITAVARLLSLDEKRRTWARVFARPPVSWSNLACLAWKAGDRLIRSRQQKIVLALESMGTSENAYLATGPPFSFESDQAMFDYLALHWQRCSLQMNALCRANGIRYYHFLQPNQYVEGSKPMSETEAALALNKDQPYCKGVIAGYPLLIRNGSELKESGVAFHDLTDIFRENREILYCDDCCHVNAKGYAIVRDAIERVIKEGWAYRAPAHEGVPAWSADGRRTKGALGEVKD